MSRGEEVELGHLGLGFGLAARVSPLFEYYDLIHLHSTSESRRNSLVYHHPTNAKFNGALPTVTVSWPDTSPCYHAGSQMFSPCHGVYRRFQWHVFWQPLHRSPWSPTPPGNLGPSRTSTEIVRAGRVYRVPRYTMAGSE